MTAAKVHTVVPAAGVGARMGAKIPKQYLLLAGQPMLALTLRRLLQVPNLGKLVVALGPEDNHWREIDPALRAQVDCVDGGAERAQSVLAGLEYLLQTEHPQDLVMVHDAARPCVRLADIDKLLATVRKDPGRGALLATSVRDTMKRGDAQNRCLRTEPRDDLWHALTPQVFQLGPLRDAIDQASVVGTVLTDESSAMEWAGQQPQLVQGCDDNIKVTRPHDVWLAEQYLSCQG